MTLKELRKEKGLTQEECSKFLNIPIRTYKRYESNEDNVNDIKMEYILRKLEEINKIDETHGILTFNKIKNTCKDVLKDYSIEYCYLFGSYAKNKAKEDSDVDLLISIPQNGIIYFEIIETLREKLKKKVDLLDINQLKNNPDLINEILKDGIKIYG